jgi:hypothetical protein
MAAQTVIHSVRLSKPRKSRPPRISRVRLARLIRYIEEMPCCHDGSNSHTPGSHNPLCRKHAMLNILGGRG